MKLIKVTYLFSLKNINVSGKNYKSITDSKSKILP